MIEDARGNLLQADAEALVNTVNCVGYMGKGIALQFRQAHPRNFDEYQRACRAGEVRPGRMLVHRTGALIGPRYILNFPTKRHWRGKSRYDDVEAGLSALVAEVRALGIRSIAVPPLGCGLGGLEWERVRPMIERAFADIPEVRVLLFAPAGAPDPASRPVATERPRMTVGRALLLHAMRSYKVLDYQLSLLEIQKLMYFLQESGQPLRLGFSRGAYGPYADNLNQVLRAIEGHYTLGYTGSRSPDEEIALLPGAMAEAEAFLADKQEERARLGRVTALIDGFETPYGMELLSSVLWVAREDPEGVRTAERAVARVHAWTERKRRVLRSDHLRLAWDRLRELGWVAEGDPRGAHELAPGELGAAAGV